MRDPRPLLEAPDPRLELEGGGCCGGLRLGGASGLPAAGTRTCIRSPRVSAELLSACTPPRLAWSQDAAPALAGELAAGGGAGLSPLTRRPGAERGRSVPETRAWAGGWWGRGGLRPSGEVERGGWVAGGWLVPVAPRPGVSGRGVRCGCLTLGLLCGRRLRPPPPPPPPVLAGAWVSGGGRSPREALEGKRQKVPRGIKVPSAGVELREREAQPRGAGRGSGPREVGEAAAAAAAAAFPAPWRRRGCARVGSEGRRSPRVGSGPRQRSAQPPAGGSHP